MRAPGRQPDGRSGWCGVFVPLLAMLVASHAAGTPPAAAPGGRKDTASPKRPARVASADGLRHTVRPGETLWTIARRHGVAVDVLARANQIDSGHRIRVGQRLLLPTGAMAPDSQEPPSPAEIILGPPPENREVGFAWPIVAPVVSPFGPRGRAWHGGIDIKGEQGMPIRAAAPGMVIASGWERGYGRVVKIWHILDFMTVYAHNQENLARVGEWVERGQVIATVGSSGRTTAPHLHLEIRLAGQKYNPLFWLPDPDSVEVASSEAPTRRSTP